VTETQHAYELNIALVANKPPLTLNQRLHFRERSRRTAAVRTEIAWRAKAAGVGRHDHVGVWLHFATGDRRSRDADNLVATLKACLDGLVTAGVISDDTPEHVTWWMPQIQAGPGVRRLWIEVIPS
jgi:crossover junction endodeoxyribonuclease RusA